MDLSTFALLVIGTAYFGLMLAERIRPARQLPVIAGWPFRGLAVSAMAFGLSLWLAPRFDGYLGSHALIDASGLPIVLGAILGAVFLESVNTLWHIALHRSPFLWRWCHQLHHSSERIDIPSAFYFSPLDQVGWTAVASFSLTFVLRLSVTATVLATTTLVVLNLLSHSNLRTPRWLGFFIVRPEMHAWHHARGRHRNNYAVLPVLDMLLGTYDNRADFPEATGFHRGASARIPQMLAGRDLGRARE